MMVWPYGAKYQIHFLEPETIQGRVKDPPVAHPRGMLGSLCSFSSALLHRSPGYIVLTEWGLQACVPTPFGRAQATNHQAQNPVTWGAVTSSTLLGFQHVVGCLLLLQEYTMVHILWPGQSDCLFICLSPAEHTFPLSAHLMVLLSISKENTVLPDMEETLL